MTKEVVNRTAKQAFAYLWNTCEKEGRNKLQTIQRILEFCNTIEGEYTSEIDRLDNIISNQKVKERLIIALLKLQSVISEVRILTLKKLEEIEN